MGSVPMPVCAPKLTLNEPCLAMRSAIIAEDTLSISSPPYCFGHIGPGQAQFAGLLQQLAA